MKTILITTALVFAGTTVMAADFDNNALKFAYERNNLEFGVSTLPGQVTDLSADITVLPYSMMGANADLTLGINYGLQSEDTTLSGTYSLSKDIDKLNLNVSVKAAYTIESDVTDGTWDATPTVGAAYRVNDQLIAFGDVGYTWDASNDWEQAGGAVEVGARYKINDNLALTPSVARSFDTDADETNLNLKVALSF